MADSPELSVVIPAMNEEDNVQTMHDRLIAALEDVVDGLEVVWVDDGSTDSTWRWSPVEAEFNSRNIWNERLG